MASPTGETAVGAGTVLAGTYELTRELGRGGMGVVFEAQHLRLPKRVAVKILNQNFQSDHDSLARFRREAEIASRLGHPHIINVVDFGEPASGSPFIVLELIEGVSLAQLLDDGPLEHERALRIARQIASALGAAHRVGVIHRDLKPANIMVEQRSVDGVTVDHAIVLDFGVSKILGSHTVQTVTKAVLGTPGYMSPEQTKGDSAAIGAQSDVFALAAIVYEMLSGKPAFDGQTAIEIAYKIVHGKRPTVPSASRRVNRALARAFESNPKKRTRDMSSFIETLTNEELELGPEPDRHLIATASEADTVRLRPDAAEPVASRPAWLPFAVLAIPIALAAFAVWNFWPSATSSQPVIAADDAPIVSRDASSVMFDAAPVLVVAADAAPRPLDAAPREKLVTKQPEFKRVEIKATGSGKQSKPKGCALDPRDGVNKLCRNYLNGRCTRFGRICGSGRSRCLFDSLNNAYFICPEVYNGRCQRFVRKPCVPQGKCMRDQAGTYRSCVRESSGRCAKFGKICIPSEF